MTPGITACEPLSTLLVSPSISPIVVPYIIPYITPFKEFRIYVAHVGVSINGGRALRVPGVRILVARAGSVLLPIHRKLHGVGVCPKAGRGLYVILRLCHRLHSALLDGPETYNQACTVFSVQFMDTGHGKELNTVLL